jgi:hypothetical protein
MAATRIKLLESSSVYTTEADGHMRNYRFMGGRNAELASGSYTYTLKRGWDDMLQINLKRD